MSKVTEPKNSMGISTYVTCISKKNSSTNRPEFQERTSTRIWGLHNNNKTSQKKKLELQRNKLHRREKSRIPKMNIKLTNKHSVNKMKVKVGWYPYFSFIQGSSETPANNYHQPFSQGKKKQEKHDKDVNVWDDPKHHTHTTKVWNGSKMWIWYAATCRQSMTARKVWRRRKEEPHLTRTVNGE